MQLKQQKYSDVLLNPIAIMLVTAVLQVVRNRILCRILRNNTCGVSAVTTCNCKNPQNENKLTQYGLETSGVQSREYGEKY